MQSAWEGVWRAACEGETWRAEQRFKVKQTRANTGRCRRHVPTCSRSGGQTHSHEQWQTSWRPALPRTACTPAAPGWAGGHQLWPGACRVPAAPVSAGNSAERAAVLRVSPGLHSASRARLLVERLGTVPTRQLSIITRMFVTETCFGVHLARARPMQSPHKTSSTHLGLRGRRWSFTFDRQAKHSG